MSVVICCHNGAKRLPETIAHLAAQRVPAEIPWEVVVIDNASTDDTAAVVMSCWPSDAPTPLKVIREPRLGKIHALDRALQEPLYEYIAFVDDDNWVSPDWVRITAEVMNAHPEVGICGGINTAVCEIDPPWWFEEFKGFFAISPNDVQTGDVTGGSAFVGAGMTLRRSAWQSVVETGHRCFVVDRHGKLLTTGRDSEMCLAVRLAGWHFLARPTLKLAALSSGWKARLEIPATCAAWLRHIFRAARCLLFSLQRSGSKLEESIAQDVAVAFSGIRSKASAPSVEIADVLEGVRRGSRHLENGNPGWPLVGILPLAELLQGRPSARARVPTQAGCVVLCSRLRNRVELKCRIHRHLRLSRSFKASVTRCGHSIGCGGISRTGTRSGQRTEEGWIFLH